MRSLLRRFACRGEHGQALVESGLLLATLIGGLAAGGTWLMKTQPQLLRALDAQIRGSYFMLSLPFP
jgi:Flp pilus assembly pilin Flp